MFEFDVKGHKVLVDDTDSDLATLNWRYHKSPNEVQGYIVRKYHVNGKETRTRLHRAIYERIIERPLLKSEIIDHKDCNPLNNQRGNLRLATPQQSMANRKVQKNNKLGVKGVRARGGKYEAQITVNKKQVYLGRFMSLELAQEAYKEAAFKYFGEYARFE